MNKKSTFTSALIIAFLSFAQNVIDTTRHSTPFQFGMFFHIIAIGFHLFAALIAARAGMICFRISKSIGTLDPQTIEGQPDDRLELPVHSSHDGRLHIANFQHFLILCEQCCGGRWDHKTSDDGGVEDTPLAPRVRIETFKEKVLCCMLYGVLDWIKVLKSRLS